jgi:NADPH-dependent glutamate synthase beta subunit-like oxidoreductase
MVESGHIVAIFGGAVAGSEAANKLAERGIRCVVFEQNSLPYGKLESGLPKWHIKLRNKEEAKIDEKLKHPLVEFVPSVTLGEDVAFEDIVQNWNFSAVLLATGAWKDRPLPIDGINDFVNRGLTYQNPFVAWFNKNHDPEVSEPQYQVLNNAIIIGGGLASIDVAKILMIENVRQILKERGYHVDVISIEKKGIPSLLSELGISFEDLNIKGCTLYYRRRLIDMPLSNLHENPTEKDYETAYRVRNKIVELAQSKYMFQFKECHQPVEKITESDRLTGIIFQKTQMGQKGLVKIEGSEYAVKSPLIVSAIGSLPEPIRGLPYTGDSFKVVDTNTGQLEGYESVFALGNAVTGRGNIKESQLHGRQVSEQVMEDYFAWQMEDYENLFDQAVSDADQKAERIGEHLETRKTLPVDQIDAIIEKVRSLQQKSGYDGNYDHWISRHLPKRVEDLIPSATQSLPLRRNEIL